MRPCMHNQPLWTVFTCALLLAIAGSVSGGHENPKQRAFVIVGGGPAGLQWGTLLQNAGILDYVILEQNDAAGSFFQQYPRARKLISANRRHMRPDRTSEFALRHDWHSLLEAPSFTKSSFSRKYYPSADELVEYMGKVAEGLNVAYNTTVARTEYSENTMLHAVHTNKGVWYAERLIIATGMRVRDIPECMKEYADQYNVQLYSYDNYPDVVTADEDFCRGKRVSVFGSGNGAFETADLMAPCASGVRIIYKHKPRFSYLTHYVGDVRISNAAILDRYKLKSIDEVSWELDACNSDFKSDYRSAIMRAQRYNRTAMQHDLTHNCADWEGCEGFRQHFRGQRGQTAIFAGGFTGMRPGVVDLEDEKQRFPATGSFWRDPSQPQRFFAGNLMHGADYRRSAGGFIHGFRYNVRAQFRHVMREFAGAPWPVERHGSLVAAFGSAIERFQNASGLYQMSDFLVDAISVAADGSATYWPELPRPWVAVEAPEVLEEGFQLHFEYSNKEVWTHELAFSPERIARSPALYLHPVITPFLGGRPLASCHVLEDLLGAWTDVWAIADLHFSLLLCAERLAAAKRGDSTAAIDLEEHVLARMDGQAFGCAPSERAGDAQEGSCPHFFYPHPPLASAPPPSYLAH